MQAEQVCLEDKNHELSEAYKEKAKAQQQTLKLYQGLKAQVMASHVAHAAGDEAEYTLQTARRDRFIDRLPGTRTGTASYNQMATSQQNGGSRLHARDASRSSRSSGLQRQGGIQNGPSFHAHLQGRGLGVRAHTSRESSLFPFSIPLSGKSAYAKVLHTDAVKNPPPLEHRRTPTKVGSQCLVDHVKTHTSIRTPAHHTKIHR